MGSDLDNLIISGFTKDQAESLIKTFGKKPKSEKGKTEGAQLWDVYETIYVDRYKTKPVRNAVTNNQCKQIVSRLGLADAIEVVSFYLKHRDGFYIKNCHSIGLCLRDAESLRTQWARGRAITNNDVKDFEKKDQNRSILEQIERGEL